MDFNQFVNGVKQAREQGSSDEDIMTHLAGLNPGFAQAKQQGFGLNEVSAHLAQKYAPQIMEQPVDLTAPHPVQQVAGSVQNLPNNTPQQDLNPYEELQHPPDPGGLAGIASKVVRWTTPVSAIAHLTAVRQAGKSPADMTPQERVQTGLELASPLAGALLGPGMRGAAALPEAVASLGVGGAGAAGAQALAGPAINDATKNWEPHLRAFAQMFPTLAGGTAAGLGAGKAMGAIANRPTAIAPENNLSSLLDLVKNKFNNPDVPNLVGADQTKGPVREALTQVQAPLGKAVGTAKEGLAADLQSKPDLVNNAVAAFEKSLSENGVPFTTDEQGGRIFKAQGSRNQAAAKIALDKLADLKTASSPAEIQNMLDDYNSTISRLASQGKNAVADPKSPLLLSSKNALESFLESQASKETVKNLDSAKAAFGQNRSIQNMISKSFNANKEFDPTLFLRQWKEMGPSVRNRSFTPEQQTAIDNLVQVGKNRTSAGAKTILNQLIKMGGGLVAGKAMSAAGVPFSPEVLELGGLFAGQKFLPNMLKSKTTFYNVPENPSSVPAVVPQIVEPNNNYLGLQRALSIAKSSGKLAQ